MRKRFITFFFLSFLAFWMTHPAGVVLAALFTPPVNPGSTDAQTGVELLQPALEPTGITATPDISALIVKYVNFLLPYLALAAFVGFAYAGILYVVSYGNDEMVDKAKKIMTYAVIGVVLVIVSYAIVQFFTVNLVERLGQP